MATTILKIKRGSGQPPASSLASGELAYDDTGNDLYIGNSLGNTADLVSEARQVEIAGDQTITGAKTINVDKLILPGTNAGVGQVLTGTDAAGNFDWAPAASLVIGSATANPSVDGEANAVDAFNNEPTPITIDVGELFVYTWPSTQGTAYIFTGSAGTYGAGADDTAPPGSMVPLGSATSFATQAEVDAGISATTAIAPNTYATNRDNVVGKPVDLNTTDKSNLVAAINENYAAIASMAGNPSFISGLTMNEAIPDGDYSAGSYFILTDGGNRTTYPAGGTDPDGGSYPDPLAVEAGDWLICATAGTIAQGAPGTAVFFLLRYSFANQTATLVSFDDAGSTLTASNVQIAIDQVDSKVESNAGDIATLQGDIVTIAGADVSISEGLLGQLRGSAGVGADLVEVDGGTYD